MASVHARFHTPHVAIAVQSVVVCAFALTSTFERLVVLANLAVLVLYALCCLAAWQLRRRDVRRAACLSRFPPWPSLPSAALVVIAWMLTGVRQDEWTALAATLAAATVGVLPDRPLPARAATLDNATAARGGFMSEKVRRAHPALWVPSLYFAMGTPMIAVTVVSAVMYKNLGLSNAEIALYTGSMYLPWVIKPLWSPIVEMFRTKKLLRAGHGAGDGGDVRGCGALALGTAPLARVGRSRSSGSRASPPPPRTSPRTASTSAR